MAETINDMIAIIAGFAQWWVPWAVLSGFLLYQNMVATKVSKEKSRVLKRCLGIFSFLHAEVEKQEKRPSGKTQERR